MFVFLVLLTIFYFTIIKQKSTRIVHLGENTFIYCSWIIQVYVHVKNICMNMNYNYVATIFRSIFDPNICISDIIYNFYFDLEKFISKNCNYIFFYQKFAHFGQKYF